MIHRTAQRRGGERSESLACLCGNCRSDKPISVSDSSGTLFPHHGRGMTLQRPIRCAPNIKPPVISCLWNGWTTSTSNAERLFLTISKHALPPVKAVWGRNQISFFDRTLTLRTVGSRIPPGSEQPHDFRYGRGLVVGPRGN